MYEITCLACSLASRASDPLHAYVLTCLCAFAFYIPSFLCALRDIILRALRAYIFLRALCAFTFYMLDVPSFFLRA